MNVNLSGAEAVFVAYTRMCEHLIVRQFTKTEPMTISGCNNDAVVVFVPTNGRAPSSVHWKEDDERTVFDHFAASEETIGSYVRTLRTLSSAAQNLEVRNFAAELADTCDTMNAGLNELSIYEAAVLALFRSGVDILYEAIEVGKSASVSGNTSGKFDGKASCLGVHYVPDGLIEFFGDNTYNRSRPSEKNLTAFVESLQSIGNRSTDSDINAIAKVWALECTNILVQSTEE